MERYAAYKDSGVEWIGEIPEGWGVNRVKYVSSNKDSLRVPVEASKRGQTSKSLYPYYGANGIQDYIDDYIFDFPAILVGEDGSVIRDDGTPYVTFATGKYWVNNHAHILIGLPSVNDRFLFFALSCVDISQKLTGTTMFKLTQGNLANIVLPIPCELEQQAIAEWLDAKTAEIDGIVEEAERSIELLREYRKSVISEAVTKGLNPDAPMKDSGIEWIGEIPTHWSTYQNKYLFSIQKRIVGYEGPTVLSITQAGIEPKDIKSGEGQLASNYSNYQWVHKGDFAMNHMDLLTGWVDCSEYDGVTSPDYRVFIPITDRVNRSFFKYIFQHCYAAKIFYGLGQGVSNFGRWRMPAEQFKNFSVPLPPHDEQQEIADYLDTKTAEIDALIADKEKQVELLKEYRKSLISEAVTGKFKVPGLE